MNGLIILALVLLAITAIILFVVVIALRQRLDSLEKYSENLEHRINVDLVNVEKRLDKYRDDFNEEKRRQQEIHEACHEALEQFDHCFDLQGETVCLLLDHLGLDIEETEPGLKLVKRETSDEK